MVKSTWQKNIKKLGICRHCFTAVGIVEERLVHLHSKKIECNANRQGESKYAELRPRKE